MMKMVARYQQAIDMGPPFGLGLESDRRFWVDPGRMMTRTSEKKS